MIAIFGQILLYAILLNSVLICYSFYKSKYHLNSPLVSSLNILSCSTFVNLIYAYITSDFSLKNVYLNSHTLKPLIFKIGGAWGNHEGSLLLMLVILCGYLWIFNKFILIEIRKKHHISSIYAIIVFCVNLYIITTSNPFEILNSSVNNGLGLNPLLQDIGLLIHPPLLYIGYMGFALIYSISLYALKSNDHDQIKLIAYFTIIPWTFLTIGIALGGWWAYRELGWGGFWFWDPVENVSLMPWLIATSLLHIVILAIKRTILLPWVYLLSIICFLVSILGSFLVRSGIITSVHSFASDPHRGIIILTFMLILIIVSMIIFIRSEAIKSKNYHFSIVSREMGILLNNLMLIIACVVIVIGTLYPLFYNLINHQTISIGEGYYNQIIGGIFIILMIIAAITLNLKWTDNNKHEEGIKLLLPCIIAFGSTYMILKIYGPAQFLVQGSLFASCFLIANNIILLFKKQLKVISFLAHAGLGILILGAVISTNYEIVLEKYIQKNEIIMIDNKKIIFKNIEHKLGTNYFIRIGVFEILINDIKLFNLYPESRLYPVEQTVTADGDIKHLWNEDVYLTIAEIKDQQFLHLRVYIKPLINLVWLGIIMMSLSGLLLIIKKFKITKI